MTHENTRAAMTAVFAGAVVLVVGCNDSSAEPIRPDPAPEGMTQQLDGSVSDAPRPECPEDLPGPKMVRVPALDGSMYCIDSRETTQAEYFAFLDAKGETLHQAGDMSGQPTQCEENIKYGQWPENDMGPGCQFRESLDWNREYPDYPVGCVDWCDAHMGAAPFERNKA